MASDLSSGCTDDIEIFNEKEEGEISLEDVSSSEEAHPNYKPGFRTAGRCPNCSMPQQCSPWCNAARTVRRRSRRKQNADHGKENRRDPKDSSSGASKHVISTLQEKNDDDDLVPISSSSEIEIVGLPGNSKHVASHTSPKSSKVLKKKKKKRNHNSSLVRFEDGPDDEDTYDLVENTIAKVVRASRPHRRETTSPRYSTGATSLVDRTVLRTASRRYRPTRVQKSRSPPRRSRAPVINHTNSAIRKVSRKLRNSRRSPFRSPVRLGVSRESRDSGSSPAYVDMYATRLLKKVRRLESVGTFSQETKRSSSREHSSLKEKLSNMLKGNESLERGDKFKSSTRSMKNPGKNENNNVAQRKEEDGRGAKEDEDEDIELLRRLALETKQKKVESKSGEATTKETNDRLGKAEANSSDANDDEALELRMIALHSAIMKKHRNRVERGLGSKKRSSGKDTRNESSFSMSFLDNIPMPDALPASSVQSTVEKSPIHTDETNNPEDMELDTDVEREKDSMPYSPTDDLSLGKINVDNDSLPINEDQEVSSKETTNREDSIADIVEPLDSSPDCRKSIEYSTSPLSPTIMERSMQSENDIENMDKGTGTPSSPEKSGYTSADSLVSSLENSDAPYSPSNPIENSTIEYAASPPPKSIAIAETPYSPTDTPIYDPELTRFSPEPNATPSKDFQAASAQNLNENPAWKEDVASPKISHNLVPMMLNMSMEENEIAGTITTELAATPSDQNAVNSSLLNVPPGFSMIDDEGMKGYAAIIDELPEIDLDGSPLVPVAKEPSNQDIDLSVDTNFSLPSLTKEPLYLQGLPEVTRDANKIPTLVNRRLVPAPILKTNKRLQKPLPRKKTENPIVPSFKRAEMRPVSETEITTVKPTNVFKPLKSCSMLKKPQVMLHAAAVFNCSFSDDTTTETHNDDASCSIREESKDSSVKTGALITAGGSAFSLTTGKLQESEESGREGGKSGVAAPLDDQRSKPPILDSFRLPNKVKAKSVETYFSNDSNTNTLKSPSLTVAGRASSSSVIDEQSPREKEMGSARTRSTSVSRMDSIETCNETNLGKSLGNKSPRRGLRKLRARRRSTQADVKKADVPKVRRYSEGEQNIAEVKASTIVTPDCRVARNKPTDSEARKSSISRRDSSSSGIDKGASSGARMDKTTRRRSIESCGEASVSKYSRTSRGRRAGREVRARRQKAQSNKKKMTKSENRGPGEGEDKGKETIEIDKSIDSTVGQESSIDSEMEKSVEKSSEEHKDRMEETEKNRRSSLDEDEEALRALLLASLPKRAKTLETSTPEATNPIAEASRLTDTTITDTSIENSSQKLPRESFYSDSSIFTCLKAPVLSSQSSSPASSIISTTVDTPTDTSKTTQATNKILTRENKADSALLSSSLPSSPLTPRKRPGSMMTKNPPKKIAKKALPVLASTKVVNNAKKYQNTILQKKLYLQKAATLYNAATGSRNITLNNLKSFENSRSPSLNANSSTKTQRFVINLESDSDSENERTKKESTSTTKPLDPSTSEQRESLDIPTTDFEKSVVQFLKDQRKKIESNAATTTSTTSSTITAAAKPSPAPSTSGAKVVGADSTPLAVRRHLPFSQQEEYRRLKQEIIERERQKLRKTMSNGLTSQNSSSKLPCTPPGPLSPASPKITALTPKSNSQRLVTQGTNRILASNEEKSREKIVDIASRINIASASKSVPSGVIGNSLVKSAGGSPRVNSRIPNISNKFANTLAPKPLGEVAQASDTKKTFLSNNTTGKIFVKQVKHEVTVATEQLPNPPKGRISNIPSQAKGIASPSVSVNEKSSSVQYSSLAPATASFATNNSSKPSVNPTAMLTIQIPNDKIPTDRSRLSSTPLKNKKAGGNEVAKDASKNTGVLRILTKEQLNTKFVKIHVERGPTGRRVTVGSTMSPLDFSIDCPVSRTLPNVSDNKIEQSVICDNNLSSNDTNATRTNEYSCSRNNRQKIRHDNSISESEASTLVLSRSENENVDSSTASTLILPRDDPQNRLSLESTRLSVGERSSSNTGKTKHTENQMKEVWEKIHSDVRSKLKFLETLPENEQRKIFLETQENLVAKRNVVLEELTEMSGCLRQWEFEREIQTKLIAEVRRLREQLRAAEDRLSEQRRQMNEMGPRVTRTHEKINHGRRECFKLSRICQGLGARLIGEDYKVPNTGAKLLSDRLKEVAVHTRQLSRKKVPAISINSFSEMGDVITSSPGASAERIEDESSPSPLRELTIRTETPSTSMSETDNEVDYDDGDEQTRENESSMSSIGLPNESTFTQELEKESNNGATWIDPLDGEIFSQDRQAKTGLVERNDKVNENEGSCSSVINVPTNVVQASSLSEKNVPSEEKEIASIPAELVLASETNTPSQETENLMEMTETSKDTEISETKRMEEASVFTECSFNINLLTVDTVENDRSENTKKETTSREINLIAIPSDSADENRAKNNLSIPGTSRSDSSSLRLLDDSKPNDKQKLRRYTSVLTHFKTSRNVDPNGILCPYELMGTCNDGDCRYYHLDPARQCP